MNKHMVHVAVIGSTATGKTCILKMFANALKQEGIETKAIDWGIDGPPATEVSEESEKRRKSAIAHKTAVVLHEVLSNRRVKRQSEESLRDFSLCVAHDQAKGFGVILYIMGTSLERWFGEFPTSLDKARMIAARLSAEMDIEMLDLIPREYDWVQPQ